MKSWGEGGRWLIERSSEFVWGSGAYVVVRLTYIEERFYIGSTYYIATIILCVYISTKASLHSQYDLPPAKAIFNEYSSEFSEYMYSYTYCMVKQRLLFYYDHLRVDAAANPPRLF